MDRKKLFLCVLCINLTVYIVSSCALCEWGDWTQIGPCRLGCDGFRMRARRMPCCQDGVTELECARLCGVSDSDMYKYLPCDELHEEKGTARQSKRSIGPSTKKCIPLDLMFVMDESASVTYDNFEKMLKFAEDLVQQLNIGEDEAMISFLTYSDNTYTHFDFNTYTKKSQVLNAIRGVPYRSGGTLIAPALQTARQKFTSTYGRRDNALSVMLFLTDGISRDKSNTLSQAGYLNGIGVEIYCIGIGSNLDSDVLGAIATNPNDHYLISANDFDDLDSKVTTFVQSLCIDNVYPTILTCNMVIGGPYGELSQSSHSPGASSECRNQLDFYGNHEVFTASTLYETEAGGVALPNTTDRDKIGNFLYGITDAKVEMIMRSFTDSETYLDQYVIKEDPDITQPHIGMLSKDVSMNLSFSMSNGVRFCMQYSANASGFVEYQNKRYTYKKAPATRELCYYYDNVAPKHCKDIGNCSSEPLTLSEEITRGRNITVTFNGWTDIYPTGATPIFASDIKSYELYLYEMKEGSLGRLIMDTSSKIDDTVCNCPEYNISLPDVSHPALYAVVLEVVDNALNVRQARRFILHDNVSEIAVHSQNPLTSTSASNNTDFTWQTNHGDICFQWKDRYYNDKMIHFNPLSPIEPDPHGLFQGIYEQTNGAIPLNGTPNVHGITNFLYRLYRENSLIVQNRSVPDFLNQSLCVPSSALSPKDGETYSFELFMSDILSHSYQESTTLYIDASVAEIDGIWLTKNGHHQLYVHDSTDLSKMKVVFRAFDPHSGLFSVQWFIGTSDDNTYFGHGAIGIQQLDANASCPASNKECYCPSVGPCQYSNFTIDLNKLISNDTHMGMHNRRYFIEIMSTNNARLESTERVDILVDKSPPETGVVKEGPPGAPDIDYSAQMDLIVSWDGFIDHESGVRFYQVAIWNSCLSEENITFAPIFREVDGDERDVGFNLPGEGKYYVTVIAYNNAFMPSLPGCSDGITIDLTPPLVLNVSLHNAKIPESLACTEDNTWVIGPGMYKRKLNETTPCFIECDRENNTTEYLRLLPLKKPHTMDSIQQCKRVLSFKEVYIYVPNDDFHLYWNVSEHEIQVSKVYVGFGSTTSSTNFPDIVGYEEANHLTFYRRHHVGLSDGDVFYIHIKIINKANVQTISSIGPIILDESKPVCIRKPDVSVDIEHVTVSWQKDIFSDDQQNLDVGIVHYRIGNSNGYITSLSTWHITNDSSTCSKGVYACIMYNTSEIQNLHPNSELPLFVTLYAENYAGYSCSVNTENIHLPSATLPAKGVVYDIIKYESDVAMKDVDVTDTLEKICVFWEGFHHREALHFMVGVGTAAGKQNIIAYRNASNENWHCFTGNNLKPYTKYFTSLRTTNSAGSVEESTNGVTIIDMRDMDLLKVYDGKDCRETQALEDLANNISLPVNACVNITVSKTLHVGQSYTLVVSPSCNSISLNSHGASVGNFSNISCEARVVPYVHFPNITVCNAIDSNTNVQNIHIRKCDQDLDYIGISHDMTVHWAIISSAAEYVSHFEFSLWRRCGSGICKEEIEPYRNVGKRRNGVLRNLDLSDGEYFFVVRGCFGDLCSMGMESNGFKVQNNGPSIGVVSANLTSRKSDCYDVNVRFEAFECSSLGKAVFYIWHLAESSTSETVLSETFVINSFQHTAKWIQDSKCVSLSKPRKMSHVCLEGYCRSGKSSTICTQVIPLVQNTAKNDEIYDLDGTSSIVKEAEKLKYSSEIGSKFKDIENAELDAAVSSVSLSGLLLGAGERNVTWYLMKDKHVPSNDCAEDDDCLLSTSTIGGLVIFPKMTLLENKIYHTCAHLEAVTVVYEFHSTKYPTITTCSDGVFIDDTPPSKGSVDVLSEYPGYITGRTIVLSWDGFADSSEYIPLGYLSSVSHYEYAVGSTKDVTDIIQYTSAGLSNGAIVYNASLTQGLIYYAMVRATDQSGHQTVSYSKPFVFDSTAPVIEDVSIGSPFWHQYFLTGDDILIHISGVHDHESGIKKTRIGVGSSSQTADVIAMEESTGDFVVIRGSGKFRDGHSYHVIVEAENHAGLTAMAVSNTFVFDGSPPTGGTVLDGNVNNEGDINFSFNTSSLSCHWRDFHDYHSSIKSYSVGLGSETGRTDIEGFIDVGLRTSWTWSVPLKQGAKHFCTVKACNGARLCTVKSSNGVILDGSNPVVGVIHVGMSGKHSKYISSRSYLETQWFGFEDPQSGIQHFEACIGTSQEVCDVVQLYNTRHETFTTFTGMNLPVNKHLYVTVKATNYAGLSSFVSSDTFVVDDTPPVIVHQPQFVFGENQTGTHDGYRWDPSQLFLKWKFQDNESSIGSHYVTLRSRQEDHSQIDTVHLPNDDHLHLLLKPGSPLREGDRYFADVTACNAAGQCTTASSQDIFIDHTPPHVGRFIFPMKWTNENQSMELKWGDFIDAESGTLRYFVGIGETFSGLELSGERIEVAHYGNSTHVQTAIANISRALTPGEQLVLSVVAENNAGLKSKLARITVEVTSTNILHTEGILSHIKHSCDVAFCNKDCTCASIGKKCSLSSFNESCVDVTQGFPNLPIVVTMGLKSDHQNYSSSTSCLSANWAVKSTSTDLDIKRFEWSFGMKDFPVGNGVFDSRHEPIWYDNGLDTSIVHCLPGDRHLLYLHKYVAYVKVWFSRTESAIFSSPPMTIDTTPPSVRRGKFIKDSDSSCTKDLEYTTSTEGITTCWQGVFSDALSGITNYKVSIGTSPGADDVLQLEDVGLSQRKIFTQLSLTPGTMYYITVQAENEVGLTRSYSSNGFVVDKTQPVPGIAFNSGNYHDVSWSFTAKAMSVSWHGFVDLHSYIREYEVAVAEADGVEDIVSGGFRYAGLQNTYTFTDLNLQQGRSYAALVRAVDAAGHVSNITRSFPLSIDITPPTPFSCSTMREILSDIIYFNQTLDWSRGNIDRADSKVYSIRVVFHGIHQHSLILFHIDGTSYTLSLKQMRDGSFTSDMKFRRADSKVNHTIGMYGKDVCKSNNCSSFIRLSKCETIRSSSLTDAISLSQISPLHINVEINIEDEESDIKSLMVGVGTTKNGYQVRPLSSTSLPSFTVEVHRPHGTPLFATVVAENHAGLRSDFSTPKPLVLDHTPPIMSEPRLFVRYTCTKPAVEGKCTIAAELRWNVEERESGLKTCLCALGTVKSIDNIREWTEMKTFTNCSWDAIEVSHGMPLHGSVECINSVELKAMAYAEPEIVSFEKPDSSETSVSFAVHNVQTTDGRNIQSHKSSLHFYWNYFYDVSGIRTYKCRLRSEQTTISEWQDVQQHNYVTYNGLDLDNGKSYTADVMAINIGGHESDVISSAIHINQLVPVLTGNTTTILPTEVSGMWTLSWREVFDLDLSLSPRFTVTMGTAKGFSDVVRNVETDVFEMKIWKGSYTKEFAYLYIVIKCRYITGTETVFRERKTM